MGEIKTNDLKEVRQKTEVEGFRSIIPESGTRIKDTINYWKKELNSLSGYGGEYNSYEDRLKHVPSESNENCDYLGIKGESLLVPSDRTEKGRNMISILKEYGVKGIEYKNGEPLFAKCAEATVKIDNMTEHREDYKNSNGEPQKGNFSQADKKCADLWNKEKRDGCTDWSEEKVYDYRKEHKLEWHERCDTKTMDLVKHEIHDFFKHTGGVYECKTRDNTESSGGKFDE